MCNMDKIENDINLLNQDLQIQHRSIQLIRTRIKHVRKVEPVSIQPTFLSTNH